MTLFDVDKTSMDRGAPTPNRPDQVIDSSVKAHKTASSDFTTDADSTTGYLQQQNKQFIANDGTTNKALFGYQPGLEKWGLFVTQDGFDVTTETDVNNFIFNSGQDTFKIVDSGTASIAPFTTSDGTENSGSVTITHNLGYVPAFFAFKQGTSGQYLGNWNGSRLLAYTFGTGHALNINGIEYQTTTITTTSITFTDKVTLSQNGGSFTTPTYNIKYFLLQETAN